MNLPDPVAQNNLHKEISSLLPWYVNNTLDVKEKERVNKHIEHCTFCCQELAALHLLAKRVTSVAIPQSSTQQSYGKLLNTIAQRDKVEQPSLIRLRQNKTIRPQFTWKNLFVYYRPLALAVMLLLLVAPMGWQLFNQMNPPTFYTLSNRMPVTTTERADLRLIFEKELDLAKIDNLLAPIGAHRVGQPGPGGVYIIRLPEQPTNQAQRDSVIAYLRQQEGVLFVEPVIKP
jgi:hypothetical protein